MSDGGNFHADFRARVEALLEQRGKSRAQLARHIGATEKGFNKRFEEKKGRNSTPLQPHEIPAAASFLNVSIEWLLTGRHGVQAPSADDVTVIMHQALQQIGRSTLVNIDPAALDQCAAILADTLVSTIRDDSGDDLAETAARNAKTLSVRLI